MLNPTDSLYSRLQDAGLSQSYLRKVVLPDWWEDSLAVIPSAYSEFLGVLSDHLGLDIRKLHDPDAKLIPKLAFPFSSIQSKLAASQETLWNQVLCCKAAQIAIQATKIPCQPDLLRVSPSAIRTTILKKAQCVDLNTLLDYVWRIGIPVLHVSMLPRYQKSPEGMAVRIGNSYAIVFSKKQNTSPRQLFILAQEIGHVALGQLAEPGAYVDARPHGLQRRPQGRGSVPLAVFIP